jgi:hypothetical protein
VGSAGAGDNPFNSKISPTEMIAKTPTITRNFQFVKNDKEEVFNLGDAFGVDSELST